MGCLGDSCGNLIGCRLHCSYLGRAALEHDPVSSNSSHCHVTFVSVAFFVCTPLPAKPVHLTSSTSPRWSLLVSNFRVLPLSFLLPGLKGGGQGRKGTHGNEKPQCSLVAFQAKKLMALEISSYFWLAFYTDGKWGNYTPGWVGGSV